VLLLGLHRVIEYQEIIDYPYFDHPIIYLTSNTKIKKTLKEGGYKDQTDEKVLEYHKPCQSEETD